MDSLNFSNIADSLKARPQWLVWRFELQDGDKKPRKVPYYASGSRRMGKQGGDADRASLVGFVDALDAAETRRMDGIGFAFLPDDGLIGIDIDGAIDLETGAMQDRAEKIIAACDSYTELSPSGKGVHIIVAGETQSNKSDDIGLEIFCGRQFFTFTGQRWPNTPREVNAINPETLERLHAAVNKAKAKRKGVSTTPTPNATSMSAPASDERHKIESALLYVSPECGYDEWVQIGMAIHAALGEAGFQVWDYWSSKGAKYPSQNALQGHWKSFKPGGGISAATIYKLAIAGGWKAPRPPRAPKVAGVRPSTNPLAGPASDFSPGNEDDSREPSQGYGAPPPMMSDEEFSSITGSESIRTPDLPLGGNSLYADWLEAPWLQKTQAGGLKPSLHNFEQFLTLHRSYEGLLAYDEFADLPVKMRDAPWDKSLEKLPSDWNQIDHDQLCGWLSTRGMEARDQSLAKAINIVARKKTFNGPKEYLEGLVHDGHCRLRTWLLDYAGACQGADFMATPERERERIRKYCELAGMKWMIGAVRRVLQPGVKMDNMLILEGDQGRLKSTVFKVLGGDWYTDAPLELEGSGLKDSQMILQGRWIIEIAEIESLNKSSTGAVKRFLSQDTDLFRPPYGALLKKAKRRCAIGGTVNHDVYLKDDSGNRRFWPVKCWKQIDIARLTEDRDQLWAEAVAMARSGVKHWVDQSDVEEAELFAAEQEKRYQADAWEELIGAFLLSRDRCTIGQVMTDALKIDIARWEKAAQTRVGIAIKRLGWKPKRETAGARERYYVAPDDWYERSGVITNSKLVNGGDDAAF